MHWILLAIGVCIEIAASASLVLSDGSTKVGYALLTLACFGVVDQSDIATGKRDLTPALEAQGEMDMILHLEGLEDVTGVALIADNRLELSMPPQWSKAAWVAMVTNRHALEALLNWFDPILPMIAFSTCPPGDMAAAQKPGERLAEI